MLGMSDVDNIVRVASESDVLCIFLDDPGLAEAVQDACHSVCPQVRAVFGERCHTAEVAFSVPGATVPLSRSMARRAGRRIDSPKALGIDTRFVASFVASVCLSLFSGPKRAEELVELYGNAPLFAMGLRHKGVFSGMPPDQVRTVFVVGDGVD